MAHPSVFEKIDRSSTFPFKCFATSIDSSSPHWHHDYEIDLILKGQVDFHVEGKRSTLFAEDLLLINSGEVHSIARRGQENIVLILQFNPAVFQGLANQADTGFRFELNTAQSEPKNKRGLSSFRKLTARIGAALFESDKSRMLHAYSDFYRLLGNLFLYTNYEMYTQKSDQDEDWVLLNRLISFIKDHYHEELDVKRICGFLGMSKSTVYRYMTKKVGITLSSFVTHFRVQEAKRILLSTDYTVSDVAGLCGFENQSTFYRVFKSEVQMTPYEFRQKRTMPAGERNPVIQGYIPHNPNEAHELLKRYQYKY